MNRFKAALSSMVIGAAWCALAHAETISISCGAVGQELELCKTGTAAWSKKTGHEVKIVSTPNSTTERLALYQQLLAAGATDIRRCSLKPAVGTSILPVFVPAPATSSCWGSKFSLRAPGHTVLKLSERHAK